MTNTQTTQGRFTHTRGAYLEEGDYVLFHGFWHRLDKRLAHPLPSSWKQRFETTRKSGEGSVIDLNYGVEYHIYTNRRI